MSTPQPGTSPDILEPGPGWPDFVCFGMQKAGTRWLFDQMNAREDIWMPPIKEINYFTGTCLKASNMKRVLSESGSMPVIPRAGDASRMQNFLSLFSRFEAHASDLDWYRRLFEFKGSRKSGDISPGYSSLSPEAVGRVARSLPECRFILLLRNPVDRLWSSLCMRVRKDQLQAGEILRWTSLRQILGREGVAIKSFPSRIWHDWSSHLPRERIRYWFFEDIVERPATVIDEICAYIGSEPGPGALPANFNRKQDQKKIQMPPDIRLRLAEHFAGELESCARIFGGHAGRWR